MLNLIEAIKSKEKLTHNPPWPPRKKYAVGNIVARS